MGNLSATRRFPRRHRRPDHQYADRLFLGCPAAQRVIAQYTAQAPGQGNTTPCTPPSYDAAVGVVFTCSACSSIPPISRQKTPSEVLPSDRLSHIYCRRDRLSCTTSARACSARSGITRPFYFLVISALLNTGSTCCLYRVRHGRGRRGLATVLAQGVSARWSSSRSCEASCIRLG